MTKLIIGCGYLGSRLARLWRQAGHRVIVTKRRAGLKTELDELGIEAIACDVLDPASLLKLPAADTVAYAVALDRSSGQAMRAVYVDGLANVLRVLPRPARFLYVSSSSVYGQTDGGWVDEDCATEPLEESGRIMLDAERVLTSGLPEAMILRFAGIYGPERMLREKAILAGEPILADADRWLNLIHVHDGVRALEAADKHGRPGRIYNVCDGCPVLRREFYAELARHLHAPPPRLLTPSAAKPLPPHEQSHRRLRNRRLVEELRFVLECPSYREGLKWR